MDHLTIDFTSSSAFNENHSPPRYLENNLDSIFVLKRFP